MIDSGESRKEVIRPDFNRAIMIDFQGATISSEVGFLLVREIDERFKIIEPVQGSLKDLRLPAQRNMPWSEPPLFIKWMNYKELLVKSPFDQGGFRGI